MDTGSKKTIKMQLPGSSYLIIGIGVFVIFIFLMFFNYPMYQSLLNIENATVTAKHQQFIQEKLSPLYVKLKEIYKEKNIEILPFPEKKKLPKSKIRTIISMIERVADNIGTLKVLSVTPNTNSMKKKNLDQENTEQNEANQDKLLAVDIKLKGEFLAFRDFMIGLVELGFIKDMDNIKIETISNSNLFFMKIWIFVE